MRLVHDLPTAGHPGRNETLRKTQEHYYWPRMKDWIADYIKGCAICQQNKILTHRRKTPVYRIPTELNTRPFQRVAMDLIMGLPPVGDKDAILTIVDQGCSRAAIFLPCSTTITGPGVAKLYQDHVFQWFGLPTKIISDRDTRFTSHFGKALMARLGIKQNLSTVTISSMYVYVYPCFPFHYSQRAVLVHYFVSVVTHTVHYKGLVIVYKNSTMRLCSAVSDYGHLRLFGYN
jgi:Integrase zinc binding domain